MGAPDSGNTNEDLAVRTGFGFFIGFSVFYNGYKYFIPGVDGKPLAPLYVSVLKDLPWLFALAAILVFALPRARDTWVRTDRRNKVFLLAYAAASLLLALGATLHVPHKSFIDLLQRDYKNLQYLPLPFLLPFLFSREPRLKQVFCGIYLFSAAASLIGLALYFFIPDIYRPYAPSATFSTHYVYGYLMSMIAVFAAADMAAQRGAARLFYEAVFVLAYAGVILSTSMGAILSLAVSVPAVLLLLRPRRGSLSRLLLVLAASTVLIHAAGLFYPLAEKYTHSLDGYRRYRKARIVTLESAFLPPAGGAKDFWKAFSRPYLPAKNLKYTNMPLNTSIAGRVEAYKGVLNYLRKAGARDVLFGDFSLSVFFEYDSYYLVLLRNNGLAGLSLFLGCFLLWCRIVMPRVILMSRTAPETLRPELAASAVVTVVSFLFMFNLAIFPIIYPVSFFVILFYSLAPYLAWREP